MRKLIPVGMFEYALGSTSAALRHVAPSAVTANIPANKERIGPRKRSKWDVRLADSIMLNRNVTFTCAPSKMSTTKPWRALLWLATEAMFANRQKQSFRRDDFHRDGDDPRSPPQPVIPPTPMSDTKRPTACWSVRRVADARKRLIRAIHTCCYSSGAA